MMQRSAIGAKRRQSNLDEAKYAAQLENLFLLHRLDFWHCTIPQRSQAGFPDYVIFGDGWLGFLELKARSSLTDRRGKVSDAQLRYKASIEKAGSEWVTFCLPDDWHDVDVYLNGHTHKGIWESASKYRGIAG